MTAHRYAASAMLLFASRVLTWSAPPPAPEAKPLPADRRPPVEQSIYIPYEKLWKTFEKNGRGVFLPYEEFRKLWDAARAGTKPEQPDKPDVAYIVNEIAADAVVSTDVMSVKARVSIELLEQGWHRVPLRLKDVGMTAARLGNEPARLGFDAAKGYHLLLRKTGEEPETVDLSLDFVRTYTKSPGRNSVSFEAPPAPISRWDIRIPEAGVKVDIHPMVAQSDAPPAPGTNETHVLAFVGAAPTVRIEWTPKSEGARGLKALYGVQAEQQVRIEEGIVRTKTKLAYTISRAELSQFLIDVPDDHKVVNVYDQNVRQWSVAPAEDAQRVTVQLFEPTKGAQALILELERFSNERSVQVPVIRAIGAGRQQGIIGVQISAGLRGEAERRDGLLQLDAGELPASLRTGKWDFSYRYAALPFDLRISVEKVEPRVLVESLVEVTVTPEHVTADMLCVYDVQRTGVFAFRLLVPGGYALRHVRGVAEGRTRAVAVDNTSLGDPAAGMRTLDVNLASKAEGRVKLELALRRPLDEAGLLTPGAAPVRLDVPLPRAKTDDVEHENGRLVVYAPESLRLNPDDLIGLRPIAHEEALAGMRSARAARQRPVLSFAFADEAASLRLDARRRAPHSTVRQLLVTRIESGVVKTDATLFYDIRYSGIKALRLDVPTALATTIRITTPGVMHTPDPDAANLPDLLPDYVPWRLTRDTEFLGSVAIRLTWETKINALEIGRSVELQVPRLVPRGVDRAWGQIVLAKAEAIDVAPTGAPTGLRPIDPQQDLMPGAEVDAAAQAYEFHHDWSLAVKATRYESKDVKATSIERGLVRMVVTRGDVTSVQALYRMRSVRQRLVIRLPDGVQFDTQPLRINGRPVTLEQGEPGEYYVPLVSQEQDEPFLLELRYIVNQADLTLLAPEFPNEPAVQQVYLSVFYPREWAYLGKKGPWNDELVWVFKGFSTWPRARRSSEELLAWVTENVGVDRGVLETFATDGRHVLYSTLRPTGGAEGALVLRVASDSIVKVVAIVVIGGLGLALLGSSLARRALVVGIALIAAVEAAVFVPSLARAIVCNATVAAGFVVLVTWSLWHMLVTAPRRRAEAARKPTADSADSQAANAPPDSGQAEDRNQEGQPPGSPPSSREQAPKPEAKADESTDAPEGGDKDA